MKTIAQQIADLSADTLIATDEGTHGMPNTVRVYERLDGSRHYTRLHGGAAISGANCTALPESEHGLMRDLAALTAAARRDQIEHLRRLEIAQAHEATVLANRRADLARGWDGYQFIGIDVAATKLAAT